MIVYRGTLTKDKLESLYKEYFKDALDLKAITLKEQDDGNWKGFMQKFGKTIEVREAKPEDCLTKLLTHNGETVD